MNPYSNGAKVYRAEGAVDYFNVIEEYAFGEVPVQKMANFSELLWRLERKVRVETLPQLPDSVVLNEVSQLSSNDYRLFYISFNGAIFVKDIQRQDDPQSVQVQFASLTQLSYQVNENTVMNYIFSMFPSFQLLSSYTISSYVLVDLQGQESLYYQFVFEDDIAIVVEVVGTQLALFSYQDSDGIIELESAVGGYLPFYDLEDQTYLEVKNFAVSRFPVLEGKVVREVRYQMVAGVNFLVEFECLPLSEDIYQVLVFKPLSLSPQILSIYRNGVDISNTIVSSNPGIPGVFNYEADATFKEVYQFFREKV